MRVLLERGNLALKVLEQTNGLRGIKLPLPEDFQEKPGSSAAVNSCRRCAVAEAHSRDAAAAAAALTEGRQQQRHVSLMSSAVCLRNGYAAGAGVGRQGGACGGGWHTRALVTAQALHRSLHPRFVFLQALLCPVWALKTPRRAQPSREYICIFFAFSGVFVLVMDSNFQVNESRWKLMCELLLM